MAKPKAKTADPNVVFIRKNDEQIINNASRTSKMIILFLVPFSLS